MTTGKKGRPPKATALHVLEGTARPDRINKNEPQAAIALPPCPKHLSPEAKKEFRRVGKQLKQLGIITKLDMAILSTYATAYGRWVKAEKELEKSELVYKTKSGYPIQNPFLAISHKQVEIMHKCFSDLGLSPAARVRLHAAPATEDEQDPFKQFMNRKKSVNA